jgi:hypothetical protein
MDVAFLVVLVFAVVLQGATVVLLAILLKKLAEASAAAKKEVAGLKQFALAILGNLGITLP